MMMFELRLIALLPFLLLLSVAYADTVNDDVTVDNNFDDSIYVDGPVGPVGIVSELYKAHSDVTGIMVDNSLTIAHTGYVHEEVYLEGTWVDEEN